MTGAGAGGGGGSWELIEGDALSIVPAMADGSVDAVIVDPPYGVNLDYNGAFDDSPENWARLAGLIPDLLRVARGPVLWFGAAPTLERDLAAFKPKPDRLLIWAPSFTLAKSRKDGLFFRWQTIWAWRLTGTAELHSDVLTEPTEARRTEWNHPGTKPVALMRRLVSVVPAGGCVLDFCCGSGTTGVACVQTGRRFIGIEQAPEHAATSRRRLSMLGAFESPLFSDLGNN